jgi:hypothetical protein
LEGSHEVSSGKPGFLGYFSHTAILTDDLGKLGVASTDLKAVIPVPNPPISDDKIARGCQILSFLQNKPMIDRGIDLFFETLEAAHTICGDFITRNWLSQLWLVHGDTLSSQNPEKIRQLCEQLCRNTATPLAFDGTTTASEWVYSATGIHIRWATLAMIANYVATYIIVSKPSDPFFDEFNVERSSLLAQMAGAADECLSFCREFDALDDVFLWALLESYSVTASTKGESGYATYRIGAELNSALVSLGLHQVIRADDRVPLFLAELRKRLRAMVFTAEIGMAAHLGRPPRLSYRFMSLDPPLDLLESELFGEHPQGLADAIAKQLDEHGYRRDGKISYVSWLRPWIKLMMRREEILELAMGNSTPEEIRQKADAIQQKTEEHWATLPPYMSNLRDSDFVIGTQNVTDMHFQNLFRQGPQGNVLLMQRVLMRKAGASPTELIRAAQGVLSHFMRTYKRIDASAAASSNIVNFMVVPVMRSAAILATELLKQEQYPSYPKNPLLPRSKTIQDLSVLTAKLADMDPGFAYKENTEQGRKVISRILDKILSPPTPAVTEQQCHSSHSQTEQLDMNTFANDLSQNIYVPESFPIMNGFSFSNAPIFGPDHDFMQWLESMDTQDWEQPLQL